MLAEPLVTWIPPPAPRGWHVDRQLGDGQRYRNIGRRLTVIMSAAAHDDGRRWVHFSLSHADRIPTWGELRTAKELFLGDVYAYQVLPPREVYVNITPRVLHLFHCLDGPVLPEFSGVIGGMRTL